MLCQVVFVLLAPHGREDEAHLGWRSGYFGIQLQMPDHDGARETALVECCRPGVHLDRTAGFAIVQRVCGLQEALVVGKPEDVEVAASVSQLCQKRLDGMDGMQQLKSSCEERKESSQR